MRWEREREAYASTSETGNRIFWQIKVGQGDDFASSQDGVMKTYHLK